MESQALRENKGQKLQILIREEITRVGPRELSNPQLSRKGAEQWGEKGTSLQSYQWLHRSLGTKSVFV